MASPSQILPLLTLPEVAAGPRRSYSSGYQVKTHYLQTLKLVLQKHFPREQAHCAINPGLGGDTEGRQQRSPSHHYWYGKATKGAAKFPELTPTPHITAALMTASGCRGQHWDFTIQSPIVHCIPTALQGNWITGQAPTFPGNKGYFPLPHRNLNSQSSARETKQDKKNQKTKNETKHTHTHKNKTKKNLWFSAIYWETIERLLINL